MFTGIVQSVGTVAARREGAAGVTFAFAADEFAEALRPGDSVSINGVCHTVERCDADGFEVTSVAQTLSVTTMSSLAEGDAVNLEQAATPDTALGGHIVQGHVDGIGVVTSFKGVGEERMLEVKLPVTVADVVVPKGSITIDGVSLTVAEAKDDRVTIAVIPYTFENTTVRDYARGTRVNVEADVIGKYVKKYVDRLRPAEL